MVPAWLRPAVPAEKTSPAGVEILCNLRPLVGRGEFAVDANQTIGDCGSDLVRSDLAVDLRGEIVGKIARVCGSVAPALPRNLVWSGFHDGPDPHACTGAMRALHYGPRGCYRFGQASPVIARRVCRKFR